MNYKLLLVLCCVTLLSKAQTTYVFTKDRTTQIMSKYINGKFEVFKVLNTEFTIPVYDTINVLTQQYSELKAVFDKLYIDSTTYATQYKESLDAYNEAAEGKEKIRTYLNTAGKFKDKSHLLAEAQKIFLKYGINQLVYADDEVNASNKKEFKAMRLYDLTNPDSFDRHLAAVYREIGLNRPYDKSLTLRQDLMTTRERMNRTTKYKVEYKKTDKTRTMKGYVMGPEIKDVSTIEGTYSKVGEYVIAKDSIHYGKNQLIESPEENRSYYSLFFNKNKNDYYLDRSGVFSFECGTNKEVSDILMTINKAGYKTSNSGDNYIIQTANGNVVLTADILEHVKSGDTKYINDIALSIKTYNSLIVQAKPMINKLANHYSAYQHGTMTPDRLTIWKQDVLTADGVLKKMTGLKGNEKSNVTNFNDQISTDKLKVFNDFWGVVSGSKVVLGI